MKVASKVAPVLLLTLLVVRMFDGVAFLLLYPIIFRPRRTRAITLPITPLSLNLRRLTEVLPNYADANIFRKFLP